MDKDCYLFVSCPFGGTEVFMKNLKSYVDSRDDVPAYWLEIPHVDPSLMKGFGSLTNNWTLRASGATFSVIQGLHKEGRSVKAAFFNHLTAVSLLLGYRRRIPCILTVDTTPVLLNCDRDWYRTEGFQTRGVMERLSRGWTRRTYSAMRYLLPWSNHARHSLLDDYGAAHERIVVLPPGIDLSHWKPRCLKADDHRKGLSVLFVGGEFVRKGGDTVLKLARDDAFRHMDFHFVTHSFTGPAPENVHVYQGITPNSGLLVKLYQECDVFVLPTRADYAPTNAVVEALAVGLPVITTGVGGLDDLITEGENGFVIPVGDSDILGKRLIQLDSNRILLQRLKSNARKYAEQNFDINLTGSRIIDLLQESGSSDR